MRVAFLGTPASAVASLEALIDHGHDVVVAVTRPDRRRSRGASASASPVKAAAERRGIPVVHRVAELDHYDLERGVVVAYGAMIPASTLARVPMLNVHFSLLPRWRGAAPVERAILAGDRETGVAIMTLEESLDTGPVHLERRVPIGDATLSELLGRLATLGAQALVEVLADPLLLANPVAQSGEPTYAAKLDSEAFHVVPSMSVEECLRVIRLERAWALVNGSRVRLVAAHGAPGQLMVESGTLDRREGLVVMGARAGAVIVDEVRPEGGRTMSADAWWNGHARSGESARWG